MIQYLILLTKRNASFGKITKFALIAVGFEQFCHEPKMTCTQNVHDPGSGSVTQGHRKKQVQKSCVSFEEECIPIHTGLMDIETLPSIFSPVRTYMATGRIIDFGSSLQPYSCTRDQNTWPSFYVHQTCLNEYSMKVIQSFTLHTFFTRKKN